MILQELQKIKNILLFVALILILVSAISHCTSYVKEKSIFVDYRHIGESIAMNTNNHQTCSYNSLDCPVCKRCLSIFSLALLLGVLSIFFSNKRWRLK